MLVASSSMKSISAYFFIFFVTGVAQAVPLFSTDHIAKGNEVHQLDGESSAAEQDDDLYASDLAADDLLLLPAPPPPPDVYFDVEASSDVAVVVGQPAFLTCRVQMTGNWTVSWVRHRDINLLTVGTDTYTPDRRFRGLHVSNSPDWTLQIKATTMEDAGDYECQLSSTPLRSHVVRLRVVEPHIEILNGPEVYLHEGSTLNLTCVISPAVDASLLLWSRHGQGLNWLYQSSDEAEARIHVYDGRLWVDRGGMGTGGGGGGAKRTGHASSLSQATPTDDQNEEDGSAQMEQEEEEEEVSTSWPTDEMMMMLMMMRDQPEVKEEELARSKEEELRGSTVSQLVVERAQMSHSGRYFCSTGTGAPEANAGTWTLVHILADEQPAAMQKENTSPSLFQKTTHWIVLVAVIIIYFHRPNTKQ